MKVNAMTDTDLLLPVGCVDCLHTAMLDLTKVSRCPSCGGDNLDLNDRVFTAAENPFASNGDDEKKRKRKKPPFANEDDEDDEDVEDESVEDEGVDDEADDSENPFAAEEAGPDEVDEADEEIGDEEVPFPPDGEEEVPGEGAPGEGVVPEKKQTPRAETDADPGSDVRLDGIPDELIGAIVKGDVQRAIEMLTQLPKGIQPMASRWVAVKVGSQKQAGADEDYDRYYRNFMADGMTPMSRDEWDRVRREDEADAEWQRKHHPYNGPLSSKRHADAMGADPAILLDTDGDPVVNPKRAYLPGGGAFLWDRREAQAMVGQVAQGHTRPVDRAVSSSDYYLRFNANRWRAMPRNAVRHIGSFHWMKRTPGSQTAQGRSEIHEVDVGAFPGAGDEDGFYAGTVTVFDDGYLLWDVSYVSPRGGEQTVASEGLTSGNVALAKEQVERQINTLVNSGLNADDLAAEGGRSRRQANSWGDPQFPAESVPVTKVRQKVRSVEPPFEEAEMELSHGEAPEYPWTVAGPTIDTHIGPKQRRLYPGIETTSHLHSAVDERDRFRCGNCGWIGERHKIRRPDDMTIACPKCGSNNILGAGRAAEGSFPGTYASRRKQAGDPGRRFWWHIDESGKKWGPFDDEARADLIGPGGSSGEAWRELTPDERVEFGTTPDVTAGRRHAKIMAIASDVLSTNPNLPAEEALRVATKTVDTHPEVL